MPNYIQSTKTKAEELLANSLVGQFYWRFSTGDNWSLNFNGYYLIAQDVVFEDEASLNQLLFSNFPSFKNTVDSDNISKCTFAAACMRQLITGVQL